MANDKFWDRCIETADGKRITNQGWVIYKRINRQIRIFDIEEKEKDHLGNIICLFLEDMIEILSHY